MLHAAETWAMKVDTLNRLRCNDRAMIPWNCNVRAKDEVSSDSLLTKLGIQDLDVVLRISRMRWFGHVERSIGWIAEVRKLNVVAKKRSGRPRKSWDEVLENDKKEVWILLTLKIVPSGEDAFEKDLSKSPTLGRGKQGSKMDMVMMMIYNLGSENKGADQTVRMRRLICAFVVRIWHKQVFSWRGSYHQIQTYFGI